MMDDNELLRYSRHLFLPDIDLAGQRRLAQASALLIGVGGLGSAVAQYLVAAGLGQLTLVDDDVVALDNLQRQVLYRPQDCGQKKVLVAQKALSQQNPAATIEAVDQRFSEKARAFVAAADVVIDASDNFATRFLINRHCVVTKTPLVSGAAVGFSGQLAVFDLRDSESPCYQCLYPDKPESAPRCSETGVIGPLVGVIGSLQALEVVKLITQAGTVMTQQLLCFDARHAVWRQHPFCRDPACCVQHPLTEVLSC